MRDADGSGQTVQGFLLGGCEDLLAQGSHLDHTITVTDSLITNSLEVACGTPTEKSRPLDVRASSSLVRESQKLYTSKVCKGKSAAARPYLALLATSSGK